MAMTPRRLLGSEFAHVGRNVDDAAAALGFHDRRNLFKKERKGGPFNVNIHHVVPLPFLNVRERTP